jgi:hypothetical protein
MPLAAFTIGGARANTAICMGNHAPGAYRNADFLKNTKTRPHRHDCPDQLRTDLTDPRGNERSVQAKVQVRDCLPGVVMAWLPPRFTPQEETAIGDVLQSVWIFPKQLRKTAAPLPGRESNFGYKRVGSSGNGSTYF